MNMPMILSISQVLPCQRDWYREHIMNPRKSESEARHVEYVRTVKRDRKKRYPVTDDEKAALSALQAVRFPVGGTDKRFARDMRCASEMTAGQVEWSSAFQSGLRVCREHSGRTTGLATGRNGARGLPRPLKMIVCNCRCDAVPPPVPPFSRS